MQHKKKFTLFHVFLIIVALIATRAIYYSFSDGFNLQRIKNTFPIDTLQNEPITNEKQQQLQHIFDQPFVYLGKGSQAYAFVSKDNQYVLKLFKCYHLKPIDWLLKLPLPGGSADQYRNEQVARREKKLQSTLASYRIARDILPTECAIIYLQMVPSPSFSQMVTFTDKIGRTYTIDIAQYGFVLQKKAELIFPVLDRLIYTKNEAAAKAIITSIIELMVQRSKKGIQDQDPDLHKNAGIIDGKVYCIDIGGFHENENIKSAHVMKPDITRFTRRLHAHLINLDTPLSRDLAAYLNSQIDTISE